MKSVTIKMNIYKDIDTTCKEFAKHCNRFVPSNTNYYSMCTVAMFACPFSKGCSEITAEDWKSILKEDCNEQ